MNINKMTLEQCKRIIANNYLAAYKKNGKQVDYSDYCIDINARMHTLSLKAFQKDIDSRGQCHEQTEPVNTISLHSAQYPLLERSLVKYTLLESFVFEYGTAQVLLILISAIVGILALLTLLNTLGV